MDIAVAQIMIHTTMSFHANFSHCVYEMRATVKAPISVADVGNKILLMASPYWKASTVICRLMCSKSEIGIMSGIVVKACPEPDGIKKFNINCKTNVTMMTNEAGTSDNSVVIPCTIVSMILPFSNNTTIPLAIPTTNAP